MSDQESCTAPGVTYCGTLLPGFDPLLQDAERHLSGIQDMESRESDILLCTYPKSGTNWTWEILNMLVKGKAEYDLGTSGDRMLEIKSLEQIDNLTSPRILDTHLPFRYLPKKHLEYGRKIVHPIRNPKDVAVSFYNHLKKDTRTITDTFPGTWSSFVSYFLRNENVYYDGWFNYELEWEKAILEKKCKNVYTFSFENLKKDPVKEIRNIAEFLQVDYTESLLESIADMCSFSKLSYAANHIKDMNRLRKTAVDGKNFQFRKGEVADWKNWFTVAQNEAFDKKFDEMMCDSNLEIIYEI